MDALVVDPQHRNAIAQAVESWINITAMRWPDQRRSARSHVRAWVGWCERTYPQDADLGQDWEKAFVAYVDHLWACGLPATEIDRVGRHIPDFLASGKLINGKSSIDFASSPFVKAALPLVRRYKSDHAQRIARLQQSLDAVADALPAGDHAEFELFRATMAMIQSSGATPDELARTRFGDVYFGREKQSGSGEYTDGSRRAYVQFANGRLALPDRGDALTRLWQHAPRFGITLTQDSSICLTLRKADQLSPMSSWSIRRLMTQVNRASQANFSVPSVRMLFTGQPE